MDVDFGGKVSELLDASILELENVFSNFKLLERSQLITTSGIKGEYVLYQGSIGDINVRQMTHILPNKRNTAMIIVYCTAPLQSGAKYDDIFIDCVKTFEWTK
jgi:hypothetical protein